MYLPVENTFPPDHDPLNTMPSASDDLHLVTCGLEDCAPLHRFEGVNDMYILHFIYRGKGYVRDKDQLISLSRGDIFLTEPEETISYFADREIPWSYMWIGFRGRKASDYLAYAGYDHVHRFGHVDQLSLIRNPLERIVTNHTCTQESDICRLAALLQVFSILNQQAGVGFSRPTDAVPCAQYVKQAQSYIAGHYSARLRISELAGCIRIDRSYLTRLFRESLGITPQEYLLQYRFTEAARLLRNTSLKVESIAHAVGYENPSSFSRMFKHVKGMTPNEYRQQQPVPPEESMHTAPL